MFLTLLRANGTVFSYLPSNGKLNTSLPFSAITYGIMCALYFALNNLKLKLHFLFLPPPKFP